MPGKFSSYTKRLRANSAAIAFLALMAISGLVRLLAVLNFRVRASWDTDGYILAARSIASLDFSNYDGKRTPIYPLLMLLAGMDWSVVRWVQSLLGIGIASMLFAITLNRTRNAASAFVVGLLGSLALSELLYEQIIYSETLCTFWIVLSLLAYARTRERERAKNRDYALLGISAALAGMTRPMFLFLGPLYFCFVMDHARPLRLRRFRDARLMLVLAPTLVLALGWSAVNRRTLNYFGVTTTLGFNLSNHSGAFMELAPPQYAKIADIYLRYRARQISTMGSQAMTIWYADGEIKRATGLSTAELSKQLTRMSLEMFAEHPLLYLESVAKSWVRFWGFDFYHFIGFFKDSTSSTVYAMLMLFGSLQLGINVVFLIIAAYSIAGWWRGRSGFDFDLGVIAIVLAGSVLQAFLEYGENVRYLAPLVPLTIYTVVKFIWARRIADHPGIAMNSGDIVSAEPSTDPCLAKASAIRSNYGAVPRR